MFGGNHQSQAFGGRGLAPRPVDYQDLIATGSSQSWSHDHAVYGAVLQDYGRDRRETQAVRSASKKRKTGQHYDESQKKSQYEKSALVSPSSSFSDRGPDGQKMSCNQMALVAVLASVKAAPHQVCVIKSGISFISNLVCSCNGEEKLMEHLIRAHGISLITTAMKSHPNEKDLRRDGSVLLRKFFDTVQENPGKNGIKAILAVMRFVPDIYDVQEGGCALLYETSKQQEFHGFLGEAGGIAVIISVLKKHHPKEENLINHALGALANLTCQSESNKRRLADADGIEVVTNTVGRHSKSNKSKYGAAVFQNLTAGQFNRAHAMIQMHSHHVIVAHMKDHPEYRFIQVCGCAALSNLIKFGPHVAAERIVVAGAVPVIVQAMKRFPNSIPLQEGACSALAKLLKGRKESIQNAVIEADGLEVITLAIINHHETNNKVASYARKAWDELAYGTSTVGSLLQQQQYATANGFRPDR